MSESQTKAGNQEFQSLNVIENLNFESFWKNLNSWKNVCITEQTWGFFKKNLIIILLFPFYWAKKP